MTAEESVSHQHVVTALETRLHLVTSELVMANARIASRDEQIGQMQNEIAGLRVKLYQAAEDKYDPSV